MTNILVFNFKRQNNWKLDDGDNIFYNEDAFVNEEGNTAWSPARSENIKTREVKIGS